MDRLTLLSSVTYVLLLLLLLCCYYAVRKITTALRYRIFVLVIGFASIALLTWTLVDNKIMDYQDANIGLGLVFFLIWAITIVVFSLSIILLFISAKKNKARLN
ncbi:MAG: potassium transporter Kef [Solibacillus sp.]